MILREPVMSDKTGIEDMVREFEEAHSAMDGFFAHTEQFNYEQWLDYNETAKTQPLEGFVPAVHYVSFDDEGMPLGFLNIRLELNDHLFNVGGNIGYSIRPQMRRRGLAKEQLRQGLERAREHGLRRVLITCHSDNEGSRRTILSQGGVLDDVRNGVERYWIEL